jgi:hypothetical protein
MDMSDFEAEKLVLVLLEPCKSSLVDVEGVDATDVLALNGAVEANAHNK